MLKLSLAFTDQAELSSVNHFTERLFWIEPASESISQRLSPSAVAV